MGTFVKFGWNGNLYVLQMFVVCELRRFRDKAFDRFDVYGQLFFQPVNLLCLYIDIVCMLIYNVCMEVVI